MTGSGSDKFSVNPKTGVISVQPCPTPGMATCLDYEQTKAYFLSYSATDNNGSGKKSVVNLRITLADDNDNPPEFEAKEYRANIDEGEANFQPSLIVRANDLDETSRLRYKIVDGNIKNLFRIDKLTGEIMVRSEDGLRLDNIPTNRIVLNIEVSDGITKDYATVEIAVRDVNDRVPAFEKTEYVAMVPEDSEVGVIVEQVKATDADYGINAQLTYRIQQGAYDDFAIDATTGEVTLSGKLNFDTRPEYQLEIVAVDGGEPSLSGEIEEVFVGLPPRKCGQFHHNSRGRCESESSAIQRAGYNLHYNPSSRMAFGPPMIGGEAFGLLQLGSKRRCLFGRRRSWNVSAILSRLGANGGVQTE